MVLLIKSPSLGFILLIVGIGMSVVEVASSKEPETKEDYSDVGLILLAAAVVKISDRLSYKQELFVREYLMRSFDQTHIDKRMALLERMIDAPVHLDEACRRILYYYPIDQRYRVIEFLMRLVNEGDRVYNRQWALIKQISDSIFVEPMVFSALFDRYGRAQQVYSTQSAGAFVQQHYRTLGLSIEASVDEIKRAYRKLVLQFHPDKWAGKTLQEQEKAKVKFIEIQTAYQKLKENKGFN
jgi:DnaJ like chaperone protein